MPATSRADLRKLGRAIAAMRREVSPALSQERLAEKAGVSRTYMSEVERGLGNLTWTALLGIAKGLGVKASEIVARAGY